eukprot:101082_1
MDKLTTWIVLTAMLYAVAVIQTYGCYRFHSAEHLLIVQKRYPKLIMIEAIAVIFHLLISLPIQTNCLMHATYFGIQSAKHFFSVYGQSYFIPMWTLHFIACIEIARLWLVSYDLHYKHSSRNNEWKSIINDSLSEKHFYLKYRMTFGNKSYIMRALLIYYLFVVILLTTLRAVYSHSTVY